MPVTILVLIRFLSNGTFCVGAWARTSAWIWELRLSPELRLALTDADRLDLGSRTSRPGQQANNDRPFDKKSYRKA